MCPYCMMHKLLFDDVSLIMHQASFAHGILPLVPPTPSFACIIIIEILFSVTNVFVYVAFLYMHMEQSSVIFVECNLQI